MSPTKSVAVIGAGPSGAIVVDALMQEEAFDVVRVFERQEMAGGCWFVSLNAYNKQRSHEVQGVAG